MSEASSSASSGIGFFGLLTIVFIALKLLGKINWSWFWVLSPIIFSVSIGIIILFVLIVIYFLIDRK
jgi:hypothetical protein